MAQRLELDPSVSENIKTHFDKAREEFLVSRYEPGVIQKLYRKQFSDMSPKLIEDVKGTFIGYAGSRRKIGNLIGMSGSINEILHVMHSYITNNEGMLQELPVIAVKENRGKYPITLYGEETELSKKLFEEFPVELDCGWTEIVSMQDKILMMVRDRGHALTIDVDVAKDDDILVRYFVPKLCNRDMIEALPGVNAKSISENGATGLFQTSKEELSKALVDFIGKVPTDADIEFKDWKEDIDWSNVKRTERKEEKRETLSDEEFSRLFQAEQAKELAMEQGQNGRRMGAIVNLQGRLKEAINKIKMKFTGKDSQQIGGNTNDETTRD